MSERWRKPAGIVAIEPYAEGVMRFGNDARLHREYDVTVTPDTFERMKLGRMCAQCYEPFEEAWPDECPVCRFQVKARQQTLLDNTYTGLKWVGPTESIDDELERMQDENLRAKHSPGSRIVVPSWAKLN